MIGAVKISVLMPAYNASRYIAAAIESVQKQTFRDWELIVVDDASQDNTGKIVELLAEADSRITLIRQEKNGGVADALNAGLSVCSGEYVARHDADDLSAAQRFDLQVSYLDSHSSVGMIGASFWFMAEDGEILCSQVMPENVPAKSSALLEGCLFCHGSVMVRKALVVDMGGYDASYACEDYELWLRMNQRVPMANLRQPLYYLRLHSASVSTVGCEKIEADAIRAAAAYGRSANKATLTASQRASRIFCVWARAYLLKFRFSEAFSILSFVGECGGVLGAKVFFAKVVCKIALFFQNRVLSVFIKAAA